VVISAWLLRRVASVPNSIVGLGFESFWMGPDVQKVWRRPFNLVAL
jgi:hypothetical protein